MIHCSKGYDRTVGESSAELQISHRLLDILILDIAAKFQTACHRTICSGNVEAYPYFHCILNDAEDHETNNLHDNTFRILVRTHCQPRCRKK